MEIIMMRVKSMIKCEEYSEALTFMNANYNFCINTLDREEMLARICAGKGFTEKAIDHYKNMLEINSANYDTYYKILKVMDFDLFDKFGNVKSISNDEQQRLMTTITSY